jgi:HK97 family phage portal protein
MKFFRSKHPTINGTQQDGILYDNGSNNTALTTYKTYLGQLSTLDAIIDTISAIASGAEYRFYKMDSKGKKKYLPLKQFNTIKINDFQTVSDFTRQMFSSLMTYNSAYIIPVESKLKTRKGFIDFFVLDPTKCKIVTGTSQTIDSIIYTAADGSEIKYPYEDVIYIPLSNDTSNAIYALPKLRSLGALFNLATGGTIMMQNYINQGGKRSSIVSKKDPLSEKGYTELKKALQSFYSSSAANSIMLNDEGLSVNLLQDNMSSFQIVNLLGFITDRFLERFAMPKFILGDYTAMMGDTAKMRLSCSMFFYTTIHPVFMSISSHFTDYIQNTMGQKNTFVEFGYEGIHLLEQNKIDQVEIAERMFKLGILSTNEVRSDYLDIDPLEAEAADRHYIAAFLQGSQPITLENFDEDIARYQGTEPVEIPSGEGGENNSEGESGVT